MYISAKLQCTNTNCNFAVLEVHSCPVWSIWTPKKLQKVPIVRVARWFINGYLDEQFCTHCLTLVGVFYLDTLSVGLVMRLRRKLRTVRKRWLGVIGIGTQEGACPYCKGTDCFLGENDLCPTCRVGTITEVRSSRRF